MCLATSDPKVIDELRRISAVTAVRPVTQSIMYASIVVPFPTPLVHLLPLSLPPSSSHHSASARSGARSIHPVAAAAVHVQANAWLAAFSRKWVSGAQHSDTTKIIVTECNCSNIYTKSLSDSDTIRVGEMTYM